MSEWMSETLTAEVGRVRRLIEERERTRAVAERSARERSWDALRKAVLEQVEPEALAYVQMSEEPDSAFNETSDFAELPIVFPGSVATVYARFMYQAGVWNRTDYGYAAWDDPDMATSRGARWVVRHPGRPDGKCVRSLAAAVYYALQGS